MFFDGKALEVFGYIFIKHINSDFQQMRQICHVFFFMQFFIHLYSVRRFDSFGFMITKNR